MSTNRSRKAANRINSERLNALALQRRRTVALTRPAAEALEARRLFTAVTWTGAAHDGQWGDPLNWSNGVVPGAADDVTAQGVGLGELQISAPTAEVHSLNLTDTTINGAVTNPVGGVVSLSGTVLTSLTNNGIVNCIGDQSSLEDLSNSAGAVINASASLAVGDTLTNSGAINLYAGADLIGLGGDGPNDVVSLTNAGTITLNPASGGQGSELEFDQVVNEGGAVILSTGGGGENMLGSGTLNNAGTIRNENSTGLSIGVGNNSINSGSIVAVGGPINVYGEGGKFSNQGSIAGLSGNLVSITVNTVEGDDLTGGTLAGNIELSGTITDTGPLINPAGDVLTLSSATVQCPVVDQGTLNVINANQLSSNLTLAAGSVLNLTSAASSGASLPVGGIVNNQGTINLLSNVNGSSPQYALLSTAGGLTNAVGGSINSSGPGYNFLEGNLDNAGSISILNTSASNSSTTGIKLEGNLIQEASGLITFGLLPTGPDQLAVSCVVGPTGTVSGASGSVQLAGTVSLLLSDGYQPVLGQAYAVITYNSASGTVSVNSPSGFSFAPSYNATHLDLVSVVNQDHLTFLNQPDATVPGGTSLGTVRVDAINASGGVDASDTSTVTLSINDGTDIFLNSALDGTLSVQLVNGVATFSDLTMEAPGSFTLRATDGADVAAASTSFTVDPVELQGNFTDGQSDSGPVDIGLTPTDGYDFVPLLEVTNGSVSYDDDGNITASGTFTSTQSDLGSPLFTGSLTFAADATAGTNVNVSAGVQVAQLPTNFTAVTLSTGQGESTYDSFVLLGGSFTLPDSLGGVQITVPGDSSSDPGFTAGPDGFGFTTGDVSVHDVSFKLGSILNVSAKDLSFKYISSPEALVVQGDFDVTLTTKGKASNGSSGTSGGLNLDLDLNLAGNNFIEYEPNQSPSVKCVAMLTYTDNNATPLFNNWFSITAATLNVNTITEAISGSVTLQVPSGKTFTGSIGFLNGYLDSIGLTGNNLAIPVPDVPGLEIQSLGGSLTGLSPTDANPTAITGTVGLSYGNIVTADLSATITLGPGLTVTDISGAASVNIADGEATGTANLDANLSNGTFGLTSLSMQAFNGQITIKGALIASTAGDLYGYETGTVTLPGAYGGTSVSATLEMLIAPQLPAAQSFVAGWFQPSILGGSQTIGLEYTFDGAWHLLLNSLPTLPAGVSPNVKPDLSPSDASQSFVVPMNQPFILLSASWANAASSVPFQIVAPDGTVYSSTNLNASMMQTVPALSSTTATTVAVNSPAAGTWQLVIPSSGGLGAVSFLGTAPLPSSSVQVTSPTTTTPATAAGSVNIGYVATDSNPGATVDLFYDTTGSGQQGTLIAAGLPLGDESYTWQTPSTISAGTYYIYAVVSDSVGVPASAYANGSVVVTGESTAQPLSLSGAFIYLTLDGNGQLESYVESDSGTGTEQTFSPSTISSILITGDPGGTGVEVNFSNGDPLPATGLTFIGAAEAFNYLYLIGTPGDDSVTVTDATLTESAEFGSASIVYGGLSLIQFVGITGADTLTQLAQPGAGASLIFDSTSSDTLAVDAGTYTFAPPAAGSGIAPVQLADLDIGAGATVVIPSAASHSDRYLFELGGLSIAGSAGAWTGRLDLGANDLDVSNDSLATLTSQLTQGYANGTWNGTGGIVSSAAASDSTYLTALGVLQNNQSGTAIYTAANPFDGAAPGAGDILVKYTYYGDTDLDGKVDGTDYSRIDNGSLTHVTGWFNGDFNYDGTIDGSDYTLIDNSFNTQGASLAALISIPQASPTRSETLRNTVGNKAAAQNSNQPPKWVPPSANVFNTSSQIAFSEAAQENIELALIKKDLIDLLEF
jgi:hypothetical protein